jgi:hypothetical protein
MNLGSFDNRVDRHGVDDADAMIVFGAETSGGLAIAMPEVKLTVFKKKYKGDFSVIGRVSKENKGTLKIIP